MALPSWISDGKPDAPLQRAAHDYYPDYCYRDYSRRHDHRSAALLRSKKETDYYYRIRINRGKGGREIDGDLLKALIATL